MRTVRVNLVHRWNRSGVSISPVTYAGFVWSDFLNLSILQSHAYKLLYEYTLFSTMPAFSKVSSAPATAEKGAMRPSLFPLLTLRDLISFDAATEDSVCVDLVRGVRDAAARLETRPSTLCRGSRAPTREVISGVTTSLHAHTSPREFVRSLLLANPIISGRLPYARRPRPFSP